MRKTMRIWKNEDAIDTVLDHVSIKEDALAKLYLDSFEIPLDDVELGDYAQEPFDRFVQDEMDRLENQLPTIAYEVFKRSGSPRTFQEVVEDVEENALDWLLQTVDYSDVDLITKVAEEEWNDARFFQEVCGGDWNKYYGVSLWD